MSVTELIAPGTATAVGSWPGTDVRDTMRIVAGELPDLPALPELPARGPGADLIGRTAVLLPGLAVERVPSGWRLTAHSGADARRAEAFWRQDLDEFEEALHATTAPVKVQLGGPITLAAGVELGSGERALADHGARADLAVALAEAAAEHVATIRRRAPSASSILVQLDEPSLAAVLQGRIPTASGYRTYRAVDASEASAALRRVCTAIEAAGGVPGVHPCLPAPDVAFLTGAGARFVSLEPLATPTHAYDPIAAALESGTWLMLGLVPGDRAPDRSAREILNALHRWRRDLGVDPNLFVARSVVTATCGMAGAAPSVARGLITRCRDIGRALVEDPDGDHVPA
jgi:hypothetical protein